MEVVWLFHTRFFIFFTTIKKIYSVLYLIQLVIAFIIYVMFLKVCLLSRKYKRTQPYLYQNDAIGHEGGKFEIVIPLVHKTMQSRDEIFSIVPDQGKWNSKFR